MATLNEIVYDIATKHGKYNIGSVKFEDLCQVIKRSVKEHYALYIRRDVERNGGSDEFYQTLNVETIKVDKSEIECVPVGCAILRTKNKIPKAVRLKLPNIFKYVGNIDRTVTFTKTNLEELPFTMYNDYTANVPRYIYKDGYIYIFNANKIKYIVVEGIFIDIVNNAICNENNTCVDLTSDDVEYPIPLDILVLISSEILTTLINA